MFWKTPKCPHCTQPLLTVGVDFADVKVICASCQQKVDPETFINSYNVDYIVNLIPEEYKENFLKGIGFERRPCNVIPKWILQIFVMLGVIVIAISAIIALIVQGNIFYVVLKLLAAGVVIVGIISYYKDATKVKWRKVKKVIESRP